MVLLWQCPSQASIPEPHPVLLTEDRLPEYPTPTPLFIHGMDESAVFITHPITPACVSIQLLKLITPLQLLPLEPLSCRMEGVSFCLEGTGIHASTSLQVPSPHSCSITLQILSFQPKASFHLGLKV